MITFDAIATPIVNENHVCFKIFSLQKLLVPWMRWLLLQYASNVSKGDRRHFIGFSMYFFRGWRVWEMTSKSPIGFILTILSSLRLFSSLEIVITTTVRLMMKNAPIITTITK